MQHNIILKESGVRFVSDPHSYFFGEKELTGVTGILSRHLFPKKYFGVSEEVLQKAAERGTRIHENCRAYDILGVATSPEAEAYAEIKELLGLETIANEYSVTDFERVASNIDTVWVKDGEIILGDYKTTSHLDTEYLSWQLSIYKYLFELVNPGLTVGRLLAIWLPQEKYGKPRSEWIAEKPMEEVKRLLECDAKGEKYETALAGIPPEVLILRERCQTITDRLESAKKEKENLYQQLYDYMEQHNIKKFEGMDFTITRVLPTVTKKFDSKAFKEKHEEIYNQFLKDSEVKGSVKITIKKKK